MGGGKKICLKGFKNRDWRVTRPANKTRKGGGGEKVVGGR